MVYNASDVSNKWSRENLESSNAVVDKIPSEDQRMKEHGAIDLEEKKRESKYKTSIKYYICIHYSAFTSGMTSMIRLFEPPEENISDSKLVWFF